jgi:hypothetical protein
VTEFGQLSVDAIATTPCFVAKLQSIAVFGQTLATPSPPLSATATKPAPSHSHFTSILFIKKVIKLIFSYCRYIEIQQAIWSPFQRHKVI